MAKTGKETFTDTDFQSPHEASIDKLTAALERAYHNPGRLMWRSFLQGVMNALGNAIGWIFIIVISGFIFQALGGIELLEGPLEKVKQGIQQSVQRSTNTFQGDQNREEGN